MEKLQGFLLVCKCSGQVNVASCETLRNCANDLRIYLKVTFLPSAHFSEFRCNCRHANRRRKKKKIMSLWLRPLFSPLCLRLHHRLDPQHTTRRHHFTPTLHRRQTRPRRVLGDDWNVWPESLEAGTHFRAELRRRPSRES